MPSVGATTTGYLATDDSTYLSAVVPYPMDNPTEKVRKVVLLLFTGIIILPLVALAFDTCVHVYRWIKTPSLETSEVAVPSAPAAAPSLPSTEAPGETWREEPASTIPIGADPNEPSAPPPEVDNVAPPAGTTHVEGVSTAPPPLRSAVSQRHLIPPAEAILLPTAFPVEGEGEGGLTRQASFRNRNSQSKSYLSRTVTVTMIFLFCFGFNKAIRHGDQIIDRLPSILVETVIGFGIQLWLSNHFSSSNN